jgi:hypothetical protein
LDGSRARRTAPLGDFERLRWCPTAA